MKRSPVSLFLALALMLSLAPRAHAAIDGAEALTKGGRITLTGDVTLTDNVSITADTVLDLNGHSITGFETFDGYISELDYNYYTCPALIVEQGATVTLRNGTLRDTVIDNRGTIRRLEALTIHAPKAGGAIRNSGTIQTVAHCQITAQIHGIDNGGHIDLIDNCDISTTVLSAVANAGGPSAISRISHCRFVCSDPLRGQGFLSNPPNDPVVIEDSVLVGYGRGGIAALDLILEAKNCVIINLNADGSGPYETSAIRIYNQDASTPPPRLENCTLIALNGACGYLDVVEKEITVMDRSDGDNPVETTRIITELVYTESMEDINCTYIPLEKVGDITPYLAWEMDPLPTPSEEEGLAHFTPVYTYTPGQFTDVPETYWGSANIARVYELGLMKGSGPDTFHLEGEVSLAQAVTMAARLNSIYETQTDSFTQGAVWYETYVDYALQHGIIDAPYQDYNQPATRAQFAAILAAALPADALEPLNAVSEDAIPDVSAGSESADAIYALYRAGILTGNDAQGTFAPGSSIDRASAAAIIARMADPSLRKHVTLGAE